MRQAADEVARWLGVFSSNVLVGADAERSVERAVEVLGEAAVGELRMWFSTTPPEKVRDAKCAVISAAIAVAHADRHVADAERELVGRLVQLAALDGATSTALLASLDTAPVLDEITARIVHPSLRELALVIAWQMINVDDSVDGAERGVYGELAKRLGIEVMRAKELRALFAA